MRLRRSRTARHFEDPQGLFAATASELVDRLELINRTFSSALALGPQAGLLRSAIDAGRDLQSFDVLITSDISEAMIATESGHRVVADEEALPFASESLNLVVSLLHLHWCNDLPGTLTQIRRTLKPDGYFLAALFGGDSLTELRQSFAQAELELEGGVSPRVSPFVDMQSMGQLLQRAGFALPVVDVERKTLHFETPLHVFHALRRSGQSNILVERQKKPLKRNTLLRACEIYTDTFGRGGTVPATFQIIFASGWAPDASQQKPLAPGSAKSRLADALKTTELPAGEKAAPAKPKR